MLATGLEDSHMRNRNVRKSTSVITSWESQCVWLTITQVFISAIRHSAALGGHLTFSPDDEKTTGNDKQHTGEQGIKWGFVKEHPP